MANETVTLSKAVEDRLNELTAQIQNGFDTGLYLGRAWASQIDMKDKDGNPIIDKDGVILKKTTKNLTLSVPEDIMMSVKKSFEVLKGSNRYITLDVCGHKLNCISARFDDLRGINTIQFTEPTVSSYQASNTEAFKKSFDLIFNQEYKAPATAKNVNAPAISEPAYF